MEVAEAIMKTSHLYSLDLRENSLHDCVGELLCQALESNKRIRKLRIERNPINFAIQQELRRCVEQNASLFEHGKVPLFKGILQNMKGKVLDGLDLKAEIEAKNEAIVLAEKRVEKLTRNLEQQIMLENSKLNVIEAERDEVQEEYDELEAKIAAQKYEQDQYISDHRNLTNGLGINATKAENEKAKISIEIAHKHALQQKKKEEFNIKRLNQQAKVREADTAMKNSQSINLTLTAQVDKLRALIAKKCIPDQESEEEGEQNQGSSTATPFVPKEQEISEKKGTNKKKGNKIKSSEN